MIGIVKFESEQQMVAKSMMCISKTISMSIVENVIRHTNLETKKGNNKKKTKKIMQKK